MADLTNRNTETSDLERRMIELATAVRMRAYAPYSQYRVGAAVADGDRIYVGANVENASYGATICAERVAICAAVSDGCRKLDRIVLVTSDAASPCGMCRQFLAEFGSQIEVLLVHSETHRVYRRLTVADLLPFPFVKFEPSEEL